MHYTFEDGSESWDSEFGDALRELNELVLSHGEPIEGNSFYWDRELKEAAQQPDARTRGRRETLWRYAHPAKRVLEVAANAGHGGLLMLASNPRLEYVAVDIGHHAYTIPALRWLRQRADGRAHAVIGDSARALPMLVAESVAPFDLIHIDGAHDMASAVADLVNAHCLISDDGKIVVDDMHLPGPRKAVTAMMGAGAFTGSIVGEVAVLQAA